MLKKIINEIQKRNAKKKFEVIKKATIDFYKKQDTVDIPNFMQSGKSYAERKAEQILKIYIKTSDDINYYYGQLIKHKAVA